MSNTEKISAYLEGEMSQAEKLEFEQALNNDAELQREVNLQKDIIEGIKEARRVEIKAMLDKVSVGGGIDASSLTLGKIVSGIAIVGMVSLGIYYLIPDNDADQQPVSSEEMVVEEPTTTIEEIPESKEVTAESGTKEEIAEVKADKPAQKPIENEPSTTREVEIKKPVEAPMFDTGNSDSLEAPTNEIVHKVESNVSSLDVEIDNTRKKYSFHYQFNQGKLFLYGDFDKDLYEILEFKTTSNKMLFLYYKDAFYPLDKQQEKITALKAVTEPTLLNKLEKVAHTNQE